MSLVFPRYLSVWKGTPFRWASKRVRSLTSILRRMFFSTSFSRRCCHVIPTVPLLQTPSHDVLGEHSDGVNLEPFVIKPDLLRVPHCRTGSLISSQPGRGRLDTGCPRVNRTIRKIIAVKRTRHWRSFALAYFCAAIDEFSSLFGAIRDSLVLQPDEFGEAQFIRFCAYKALKDQLFVESARNKASRRAIEFGGSNGYIKNMLDGTTYEIAPNFPEVDVQNLSGYGDNSYDIVVIDNVLEHVTDPKRAVSEILRILKTSGVCICLTPFLVRIHGYPKDYWRFTASGLKAIFADFGDVKVWSWGNRFTLKTTMKLGWLSVRNSKRLFRAALQNEEDWPITYLTIARK
jgi:Methyltransferase domain